MTGGQDGAFTAQDIDVHLRLGFVDAALGLAGLLDGGMQDFRGAGLGERGQLEHGQFAQFVGLLDAGLRHRLVTIHRVAADADRAGERTGSVEDRQSAGEGDQPAVADFDAIERRLGLLVRAGEFTDQSSGQLEEPGRAGFAHGNVRGALPGAVGLGGGQERAFAAEDVHVHPAFLAFEDATLHLLRLLPGRLDDFFRGFLGEGREHNHGGPGRRLGGIGSQPSAETCPYGEC